MGDGALRFVSEDVAGQLFDNIQNNIDRYRQGNFNELSKENGWAIETRSVLIAPEFGENLEYSKEPAAEIVNSLQVFNSLKGMTPALARDERIWVRLCHIEALEYSRKRWPETSDPVGNIRKHFFARSLGACRDDNAVGRLWWNGYLATLIDPEEPERVLRQMLKRANIRMHFVERANSSFRLPLARGLIRLLEREDWLNSHDRAFQQYMLTLDKNGGGRIYEAFSATEIDDFLSANLPTAKLALKQLIG